MKGHQLDGATTVVEHEYDCRLRAADLDLPDEPAEVDFATVDRDHGHVGRVVQNRR